MTPSAQTAGGRRVRRWTRELIIDKIVEWEARYGEPPCSADWNPSLARWRAQEWRAERYREGVWPSTNAAKRPFGGSFVAAALERACRAEARAAGAVAERRARELSALVAGGQRRLTAHELASLGSDGPSGPAVLAAALRRLAKARAAGDRGALRASLGDVASAAVRWHDRL